MEKAINFWNNHHIYIIATLWMILSAVINQLTQFQSVEKWVEFGEKWPRTQNIIRLIRASGIEPAKILDAIINIINNKAANSKK